MGRQQIVAVGLALIQSQVDVDRVNDFIIIIIVLVITANVVTICCRRTALVRKLSERFNEIQAVIRCRADDFPSNAVLGMHVVQCSCNYVVGVPSLQTS